MAHIIEDRVMETSTTTGTGNFSLAGAVTGFIDFDSVMANGDTCYYLIEAVDGSGVPTGAFETGLGTFNDTDTLVRTAVWRSSNANAAVDFAAGTKRVSLVENSRMIGRGTSFPSSPYSGEIFTRTDRNIEYYYDGTRWLSTQQFTLPFQTNNTSGFTGDGIILRGPVPFKGTYSLWLENWQTVSILTATATWVINLIYSDSANAQTTVVGRSTSGDSASVWVPGSASIAAQLSSDALTLELRVDEQTGTATLSAFAFLTYRLIG